jgi:hypothetical protein
MPNRIIRDAVLDSDKYDALPIEARLAFFEMLLRADDYGLIPLAHLWLRRHCPVFDGRSVDFADSVISSLADQDLVRVYVHDGKRFAFIPQFGNRPQAIAPKYPVPPASLTGGAIEEAQTRAKNLARSLKRQSDINQRVSEFEPGAHRVATVSESPETETETETETEKTKEKTKPKAHDKRAPVDLPDWLRAEDWRSYVEHRQRLRKPMTPRAQALAIGGLEKLRQAGHDPKAVIEQSLLQGWQGLYPINSTGPRRMTNAEKVAEAEKLIFGESDGTAGIQAIR